MNKLIRPNLIRKTFVSGGNVNLAIETRDDVFPLSACLCIPLKNDEANFDTIVNNIRVLQRYFSKSFVVFVESGSTDKTADMFSKLDNTLFIHLDGANEAAQRNAYLSFVVRNNRVFDIMIVLDTHVSLKKPIDKTVLTCLSHAKYSTWDAVFANQSYKYYDIASLRSKDVTSDLSELPEDDRIQKIRSLRQHIPRDEKYIPVISAFGGLGIYKTRFLEKCEYKNDGHVSFNVLFNKQSQKMFIDPSLVLETLEENAHLYL